MRLLKIEASGGFSLVEMEGDNMQPYAILSHVWGRPEEEVSFRDLVDKMGSSKAGYDKIANCAMEAEKQNIHFIWVDTCCIDKSSSAELSEAINSMYQWYEDATICYAYLSDISYPEGSLPEDQATVDISESKWFQRGWTLQELIAPPEVVFYSEEWIRIGTKSNRIEGISKITGIDRRVLGGAHPSVCSIADRMSWAAKRKTTRVEDTAYSLLGIFDINMPLLYGERGKAFLRLQEEIMKASDDQSLFAWASSDRIDHAGLLATSPEYFDPTRSISSPDILNGVKPSSVTSRGIHATFFLESTPVERGTYYAHLACHRRSDGHQYAIMLLHIEGDQYSRIRTDVLEARGPLDRPDLGRGKHSVYIRQNLFQPLQISRFPGNANARDGLQWFWIRGTRNLQFAPMTELKWYPDIAVVGLRPKQIGRVMVTTRGSEDEKISLTFGIRNGHTFCKLVIVSADLEPLNYSGFGYYQVLMRNDGPPSKPRMFMTARIGQVEVRSCPCTVVTLCSKTVTL